MDFYALDRDFKLLTVGIPYDNVQWTRRYYTSGQFTMQLPLSSYDPEWAYIGTPEREELAMVQRRETDGSMILLSGFFCENMLNMKAIYPKYTPKVYELFGDEGVTLPIEECARDIFETYKKDLPVELGKPNQPMLNDDVYVETEDDQLGTKLFSILETKESSYRVRYDYLDNKLLFEVWRGKDRTTSQKDNSYQIFSTEFQNIASRSYVTDSSDYYNYAIVPADADEDGKERETLYIDLSNGGFKRETVIDMRSSSPSNDQTMATWRNGVIQEATEQLINYAIVEDIQITPSTKAGYMRDYDLGDKCDVHLSDIGASMESRIVEVFEVIKKEGHDITLGFGNKRITNIRRAVM